MGFLNTIFNLTHAMKHELPFAWAKDLESFDDVAAIEFATHQLNVDAKKDILEGELYKDEDYLKALLAVDDKTNAIVERMTTHYINIDNMSIELEERVANSVFLYHRQLYLIYKALVEKLATPELTPLEAGGLLVLIARAMHNATQMIKWRYYNYQSAPANVWLQLSKLYMTAEKLALLEEHVRAYPNQEKITLSSAYVRACMIGSLETLSFQRKQIELVSKMLTYWLPKIQVQEKFDEKKHLFYVDTKNDSPAKRIRNFKPLDSYRYWCFDSVNLKVELCLSLIEFNIEPKQQEMKEFISNPYALATLEILRTEWSRVEYKRQRRADERIITAKFATTSFGYENTLYQISQQSNQSQRKNQASQSSKSFEERLASHYVPKDHSDSNVIFLDLGASESKVVNESSRGIGLHIDKASSEVSLGMMIGVSIIDQKDGTKVGMIRSIKPIIGNELQIGILILNRSAISVDIKNMSVKPASNKLSANSNFASGNFGNFGVDDESASFSCMFLPKEDGFNETETIILPKLKYNKNDTYKISALGEDMLIKLTETLETHDNWVRVAFTQDLDKKLASNAIQATASF